MTPTADTTLAPPTSRVLRAMWGMALVVTFLGVERHVIDALAERAAGPDGGATVWSSLPWQTWAFAGAHVGAALASLVVGYVVLSWCYPLRGLMRLAHDNTAAAIQGASHLLAAAAVATASWGGCDAASLGISAAFCTLGWLAIALLAAGHRLMTRYHDHEEIAAGNTASALASAGLHLAMGLVVAHAIQGQFLGWSQAITGFIFSAFYGLLLFPFRQIVLAPVILGMTSRALDEAVAGRRDHVLGAIEGVCYVLGVLALAAAW